MQIDVTKSHGQVKARLQGTLEISDVVESRVRLLQVLEAGAELTIDFSNVVEIDTSGVQLVLALRKEADAEGKNCRFVHPSQPIAEVFRLLGCVGVFDESVLTSQAKG